MSQRYDAIRLDLADPKVSVDKLENGMRRIHNPVVSRAGVFEYRNPDGSVRLELRHPDEVFRADSMASFANQVVTVMHPGIVTADNAQAHQVGSIGDSLFRDGMLLRASTITLQQSRGVEAAQDGNQDLSLGYTLNLDVHGGVFEGQRFDARQTDIQGNHVALVPHGRAGSVASLPRFDSASHANMGAAPTTTEGAMPRMTIDGVEHEVPDGLIGPIKTVLMAAQVARQDAKDASERLQTSETAQATLQGLLDKAKAERTDAADIDKMVAEKVQARFDLVNSWSASMPEGFDKGLTLDQIKAAVLAQHVPTLETKGWGGQRLDDSLEVVEKSSLSSAASKADRKAKVNALRGDANAASVSTPAQTDIERANAAQLAYSRRNNGVPLRNNTRDSGGAS